MLRRRRREPGREAYEAAVWLRLELLNAVIGYGIYAALSEGGEPAVREWREALDWAQALISAMPDPDAEAPREMPAWLRQEIEAIDALEQRGAEPTDMFGDAAVRGWARNEFERLAELARPIEQATGEPLGEVEDMPRRAGLRLFGAITDSLVLASSEDAETRKRRASGAEIYADLLAAREEGVWEFFEG
jgi:hypothetical protein